MRTRESENNYESHDSQDRQGEEATLGAGRPAAHQWIAKRMCGQKMVFEHDSAVSYAEDERLSPVPGGVKANSPPKRSGAPKAKTKYKASQACAERADRRLAGVPEVTEPEEGGGEE